MTFTKALGLLALLVVALLTIACGSDDPTATPDDTKDAAILGEPFTLKVGQSANLAEVDLTLSFISVTQDSRCPSDVTCIRAGDATIVLTVTAMNGERDELSLTLASNGEATAQSFDVAVTVSNLLPYPVSTSPIAPGDYQITVTVR